MAARTSLLLLLLAVSLAACATSRGAAPQATAPVDGAPAPEVLRLRRPAGGEWMGLYLLGSKAGWLHADVAPDRFEGAPAIRAEIALGLDVRVGGNVASRHVVDRRWYERRSGGRLLGFEAIRTGDGGDRRTVGRCDADRCVVVTTHAGGSDRRIVPLPPETADEADPIRLAAARRDVVEVTWLDLDELDLRTARHRFAGEEDGRVRVETREAGALEDWVTLLDEAGATVEVRIGPGLVARAEPEIEARTLQAPAEILALTRVPLPVALPDAPARLILELEGLAPGLWRDDGRQRFEALDDGAVRVHIDAGGVLPAPAIDRARFLAETPSVDWRAPGIEALARELLRGRCGDEAEAARLLLDAVHERLEKVYGSSSDRASAVLAAGRGDCTEHALLFVALARAAGIPARRVHGLAAAGEDALYWHEWAEVWLDGAWIAVDPTFGQFPADATHLSLGVEAEGGATAALGRIHVRRAVAEEAPAFR